MREAESSPRTPTGVVVQPSVVTDEQAHALAKTLRLKIEQELDYPSTIKITVIREQRYTETAT